MSPVAKRFNKGAHSVSDMTVIVIEVSPSRDLCLQKVKEGMWIRTVFSPLVRAQPVNFVH